MHRLPSKWLPLALLASALFVISWASPARAASKDKAAEALYDEAMDEDYLNTDFDAALEKLNKGVKLCGKKNCSKKVLGSLWVAIGVVEGGGNNDKKAAKAAFIQAFKADKSAKPVDDYMAADLKKLFKEAEEEAKGSGDDDDDDDDDDDKPPPPKGDDDDDDDSPPPGGDLEFNAPDEALVNTPLPLFVKVPEDMGAESLKVRYKPFGGTKWLSVKMSQGKGGFAGIIPCKEITTTGELKLYVVVKDKEGDPIATAGTRKAPLIVEIRNEIDGDQPNLPGEDPPEKCAAAADCPPDFPGCSPGGGPSGECKGWGASCESNGECCDGYGCLNGVCEQGAGDDDDDDGPSSPDDYPKNLISLGLQIDLLNIDSAQNACGVVSSSGKFTQDLDNYFCFVEDGEYLGKPADGKFNEVVGGLAVAGARVLVGYDRLLWQGLAAGVRLGFAFGGSPSVGDAEDRYKECKDTGGANCREPLASDFMPFHAEIRASYFFPDPKGFADGLVRPYGFVGGGLAQVNAGVAVALCDTVDKNGQPIVGGGGGRCPANTEKRDDVEAYQVTGLNFIGLGAGSLFAVHPMFGVNVEAKFMIMLPTSGFVIAPTVSPVFMF